jgi:TetR/AcrR family transcriptional regulator, acrAB operon repressor
MRQGRGMARKPNGAPEATRELLLDAAEHLFASNGVAKTSLADVAAAAGFTRGALYWHFSGKGELLDALFARFETPLDDMARAVLDQPHPLCALRNYWLDVMAYIQDSERARRILEIRMRKCEYIDEFKETDARCARWINDTLVLIRRVFEDAAARGMLAPTVDPASAAASLIGLLSGFGYLSVSLGGRVAIDGAAALGQFFDLVAAKPLEGSAQYFGDHAAA